MEHWFDDLCKRLVADSKVSRRTALGGMLAGLAATGSNLPGRGNALAQAAPPRRAPPIPVPPIPAVGGCVSRIAGNLVIREVSIDRGGITARRQLTYDRASHVVTSSTTISRTGPGLPRPTLIFQIGVTPSVPRGTTTTVDYGPEVKGVQHVIMTSQDGKTFQGSMDGRAFTTSGSPGSMTVRFADGRPPQKSLQTRNSMQ